MEADTNIFLTKDFVGPTRVALTTFIVVCRFAGRPCRIMDLVLQNLRYQFMQNSGVHLVLSSDSAATKTPVTGY